MLIGYGKIGRSMPLSLERCGHLGGDVEMTATVKTLALRRPQDTFVLIGRNDGSRPADVGLPSNVVNPWTEWGPQLRERRLARGLNVSNLTIEQHHAVGELYSELTAATFASLDAVIMWIGQHGTTNMPLPGIRNPAELTKPHDWCAHYAAFLLRGINAWRDVDPFEREEVWLNADPRNYLKLRDLKWPLRHPVLTQYAFTNAVKHERYGDTETVSRYWRELGVTEQLRPGESSGVWKSRVHNVYSRLEVNALVPGTPSGDLIEFNDDWNDRVPFGLFINEQRRYVNEELARVTAMKRWVLPLEPSWVHGTWSTESLAEFAPWGWGGENAERPITSVPWENYYPRLNSTRCTFTTPASGSRWATAKPWEAFAAGTVCFFHPQYDAQDNILADAPSGLLGWLRVSSPKELELRVKHLSSNAGRADWSWVVLAQRAHLARALRDLDYVRHIEKRLS